MWGGGGMVARTKFTVRSAWTAVATELADPRNGIALMIAVVSVAGAVVAWRASVAETAAEEMHVRYVQELLQVELRNAYWDGMIDQDLRFFARYQAHLRAYRMLGREAARTEDTVQRAILDSQAQAELAMARLEQGYFRAGTPDFGNRDGQVVYDPDYVKNAKTSNDATLLSLHPSDTKDAAERAHTRAWWLDGVFALLILSLFFLTVGSLRRRALDDVWVVAGGAVALSGLIAFIWVMTR